jgi:exopolysaccharide biosynthesis polyprenyl glycosylphosphotransferase
MLTTSPTPAGIVSPASFAIPSSARVVPGVRAVVKRVLDMCGAAVGLAVCAVPMLLIACAIKLTSRGPVLYVQARVGQGGRQFKLLKFRSMCVDAERDTGPVWAQSGDPRRTRVGVMLRRFSLDELPQLVNVLVGDMSLVGPRPERPCFVEQFARRLPAYDRRHAVKPGLTGLAQVRGFRGNTCIVGRLEADLEYVERSSLLLDVEILLRTVPTVVQGTSAC